MKFLNKLSNTISNAISNVGGMVKKQPQTTAFVVNETKKTLHKNLDFTASEQYKLLRANLNFVLPEDEACPVIGITSSMRGEGKSTTSINLSYVLAEKGSRVLLIDGDLRLPTVAKKLGIKETVGLTDLLMGKGFRMEDIQSDLMKNWFILPAGKVPPNPSELLGSKRMETVLQKLQELFDYIIIDLPPINIVSDAVAVSHLTSGMVVVMREGYTEKRELDACLRQLELANARILGCVVNCVKQRSGHYGRYKHSDKYKYYGDRDEHGAEQNQKL